MANPTTNYGFVLPTSSDLVTDLPADFEVALQGVDTSLKALQPGTTLGDLAYSSATANTNTRLGVGSNGQVLTVAGGVPSWAAPSSKIIQVVSASTSTSVTSSSSSQADTNLTATITPTSATSTIAVFIAQNGVAKNSGNASNSVDLYLHRNASQILTIQVAAAHTNTTVRNDIGSVSCNYVDSPASTSALTYKTRFRNDNNTAEVYVQLGGSTSTIILMEIGA
jgi:hypothetical protein